MTPSPEDPFKFMVHNLRDFLKARRCGEKSFDEVKKNTFKFTDCGAWIEEGRGVLMEDGGIVVGSIVEGADYDATTHVLSYPFEIQEFWDALKEVETEADQIWREINEGDDQDTICNIKRQETKGV